MSTIDISGSVQKEQARFRKLLRELKRPHPGRWVADKPGWPSSSEMASQIEQIENLISENDKVRNSQSELNSSRSANGPSQHLAAAQNSVAIGAPRTSTKPH